MASFVFIACEKPNEELGLNAVLGDQRGLADTVLPVISYTLKTDSILVALNYNNQLSIGRYAGTRMVGSVVDGHFGRTRSSVVAQMLLNNVNIDFGNNPVVDSAYLLLRYSGAYGDTTQSMTFAVHQLAEGLSRDSIFYSSFRPTLGEQINLPHAIRPRPNTNLQFGSTSISPTLAIPLDPAFFQQNFADVGDGNFSGFSSNEDFIEYFRGIQVSTVTEQGAIVYFNLNNVNSSIRIFYHNDDEADLEASLSFNQETNPVPMHFSIFDRDYQSYPTGFDLSQVDSNSGEAMTYTQAMGGVFTVLEIPGLEALRNRNLLINRAELEIRKAGGSGFALPPPSRLELREITGGSPGPVIGDFRSQPGSSGLEGDGRFRSEPLKQGVYRFAITRFLFDQIKGGNTSRLALVPQIKSTAAHRVILEGGRLPDQPIELKIYYTKTD